MQISLKWLNNYVDLNGKSVNEISAALTDCGLEVEGVEQHQNIKGGLEGLVVGKVVEKWKHPDADKLSLTKVDYGVGELVQVVCGAPNVEAGQKVVFAPVGSKVYPTSAEPFDIKKGKIRGYESLGMICAEDEIGLGVSHEGILVLPADAPIGMSAAKFFNLENDNVLEVAILPNRCDAASYMGVAKDLVAALNSRVRKTNGTDLLKIEHPKITLEKTEFPVNNQICIEVNEPELCPRYTGLSISGVKVGPSPNWLKQRLESVGQKPINNIVDITNFVLLETGQPLHAFDADTIKGQKVIVKKADKGQKFTTLDGKERELLGEELMICNAEEPMVIAGVFGGLNSGVSIQTQNIFLESAYFNPVSVRKTSKLHSIKTDSSFRFERGTDPEATPEVLLRAADLIVQLAGGKIASAIQDVYPEPILKKEVELEWNKLDLLLGYSLDRTEIKSILVDLGFTILKQNDYFLLLGVPTSKNDVSRFQDVAEEIVRVFGPNNIPMPDFIRMPADLPVYKSADKLKNLVAQTLAYNGSFEALNNSLCNSQYTEIYGGDEVVKILNPLSSELSIMRPTLLFGLLESVRYNLNRKTKSVSLFEFGKTYLSAKLIENPNPEFLPQHKETAQLAIALSGDGLPEHFKAKSESVAFQTLKKQLALISDKTGLPLQLVAAKEQHPFYKYSFQIQCRNKVVGNCGSVSGKVLGQFEIAQEVFFAEINWDSFSKLSETVKTRFKEVSKFPEVRRDLALLLDKQVKYADLERIAFQTEKKLLKNVNLFDVFEGKNLPEGKKSYALSFILQDNEATLTDQTIDKVMTRLTDSFQKEFAAELRR
jgi:phenylalanyl-tRNA synthetase beta chain